MTNVINGETKVAVLLGDPVAHSRSPQIHNAAFQALGLNWVYVAMAVRPDDLAAAVAGLRALNVAGANVTIPHKEAILPLLDGCSEGARAVGAVNTIVRRGSKLFGENTDVAGFLEPLEAFRTDVQGREAVVLGAGGAARAAVYALLTEMKLSRLTIAARTQARAEQLAVDLASLDRSQTLAVVPVDKAGPAIRTSILVVNATPVGMHPNVEETPWEQVQDFSKDQMVYDLVYTPHETRLLREAARCGARTIGGMEMLFAQAAASFKLWTGEEMPLE